MSYPGIDKIDSRIICRMMGSGMQHRIGAGFIKKSGIHEDQINIDPTFYSMSYVIRGQGEYIDARGTRYPLSVGSIFQRIPGRRQSTILNPKSNWAECFIDFGEPLCRTLDEMGVIRSNLPVFEIHPLVLYEKNIYQLVLDMKNASSDELQAIFIRTLDILGEIYAARISNQPYDNEGFIRRASNLLNAAAIDRTDLRTLVESHGWGYEWFRKVFKQELGISPGQYVLRHRLEMACNMIQSTNMNFGEIAEKLGYNNPYEFSSQFKKYLGKTPGQYRKERILHL